MYIVWYFKTFIYRRYRNSIIISNVFGTKKVRVKTQGTKY